MRWLREVEKTLRGLTGKAKVRMRRLQGATWQEALAAFGAAVSPEDEPIAEAILDQVKDFKARAVPRLIGGKEYRPNSTHGFVAWIALLHLGAASLPNRIPRAVLLAWRDGYLSNFGCRGQPWSPSPFWRCEDCRMALPNAVPGGGSMSWDNCPVCRSTRLWRADLSKPLGKNWIDPHANYRSSAAD